jgi:hypothetical protein
MSNLPVACKRPNFGKRAYCYMTRTQEQTFTRVQRGRHFTGRMQMETRSDSPETSRQVIVRYLTQA